MHRHRRTHTALLTLGVALALVSVAPSARAQSTPDRPLVVTARLDVPNVYFLRGIRQEGDPKLTLFPSVGVGLRLMSGDGAIRGISVGAGLWNSFNTGTAGRKGPSHKAYYEQDWSGAVTIGLAHQVQISPSFIARRSPNDSFETVKEVDVNVSQGGTIAPYAILAFELGNARSGQVDGGVHPGKYLELGASPHRLVGRFGVAVPVKVGLSLSNYYELTDRTGTTSDHPFGFFGVGGLATWPLTSRGSRLGQWDLHGGVDFLRLGDATTAFNRDKKTAVVGLGGIAIRY